MNTTYQQTIFDVIVIGNGPAGLSAAINVRQRNGSVLVMGLPLAGNPLYKAAEVDNYPGLEKISGKALLEKMTEHARHKGALFTEERVLAALPYDGKWMVTSGKNIYTGRHVVFAGGVVRGGTFPGEGQFLGRGVSYCATCDGMLYRNKNILIIGYSEGDAADVAYLKGLSPHVTYIRSPKHVAIQGGTHVESVTVDGRTIPVDGLFLLRPVLSPATVLKGLELEDGFVKIDDACQTNLPGVYAAGDCTGAPFQVAKAVGQGLVAGQAAVHYSASL